ncbi:MAG: hypothetical protein OXU81_13715 [Gammaproteobacteria bacterium]|nr:hypothetical protein [Gammaproteobacteria bacterium]
MTSGPPDLPRALGAVVALAGFAAVALDLWPGLAARFEPRVVAHVGAGGTSDVVVQRDRSGHYTVPESVNGVDVEFLLDTGASSVAMAMHRPNPRRVLTAPRMLLTEPTRRRTPR